MAKFTIVMKEKTKGFGAKTIEFAIPENVYRGIMDVLSGKSQIVPIQQSAPVEDVSESELADVDPSPAGSE